MDRKMPFIIAGAVGALFCLLYAGLLSGRETFTHDTIVFFGIVQYFFDNLARGVVAYWDPYLTSGTFFYPNAPVQGLLDPVVFIVFLIVKIFHLAPLTGYACLMLARLFLTVLGAFYLFRHIAGDATSAVIAAGALLLALPHSYFHQFGVVGHLYLTPFALYFLIRFLEEPVGPRRLLFLACLVVVTGVSLNIYIPAHYLFNFLVVLLCLFVFGTVSAREIAGRFRERKTLFVSGALLLLLLLMLSVPMLVYRFDASATGELFPMQRIIQKNNRVFKKILASETSTSNLSGKFTHDLAVFNSTGNVVNLLYPDILTSFKYWTRRDVDQLSEIYFYIGTIPFILSLIGILYHHSKYKPVILVALVLTFLCGFSVSGVHDQPYNLIQQVLNFLFPPLTMIQGRQNFGYFVLLYLCAFAGLGLSLVLNDEAFLRQKRHHIAILGLALIIVKIVVTGYYADKALVVSALDAFVILQIVVFVLLVYARAAERLSRSVFLAAITAALLLDLGLYNRAGHDEILQDSASFRDILASREQSPSVDAFQYFREPFVIMPFPHALAFEESIARDKGALSYGFNHSFFTTRRYYDFLTHVPLQNQFALDGVVYPIVRFYPLGQVVRAADKQEVLDLYSKADPSLVADRLYIEEGEGIPRTQSPMKDFSQYEDVPWLLPDSLADFSESFFNANGRILQSIRDNAGQFLHSPEASIDVVDFSANTVTIQVKNIMDGYLYYNDGWSKYWQAFDGEKQIPVRIANYNFKAVYLAAGVHRVRFVFNPIHYKLGLLAYFGGLVASGGLALYFSLAARNGRNAQGARK